MDQLRGTREGRRSVAISVRSYLIYIILLLYNMICIVYILYDINSIYGIDPRTLNALRRHEAYILNAIDSASFAYAPRGARVWCDAPPSKASDWCARRCSKSAAWCSWSSRRLLRTSWRSWRCWSRPCHIDIIDILHIGCILYI